MESVTSKAEVERKIRSHYIGKRLPTDDFIRTVRDCLEASADLPSTDYYFSRELKKIREEGYPMSLLLESKLLEADFVQISGDEHSRYDAVVTSNGQSQFLEVTFFRDGQFEKIRANHMDTFGSAPINGVTKEELRQAVENGQPCWGEAVLTDDTVRFCIEGIQSLIEKKLGKGYPSETILVIAFEDDGRKSTFDKIAKGIKLNKPSHFSKYYLVSTATRNCNILS